MHIHIHSVRVPGGRAHTPCQPVPPRPAGRAVIGQGLAGGPAAGGVGGGRGLPADVPAFEAAIRIWCGVSVVLAELFLVVELRALCSSSRSSTARDSASADIAAYCAPCGIQHASIAQPFCRVFFATNSRILRDITTSITDTGIRNI